MSERFGGEHVDVSDYGYDRLARAARSFQQDEEPSPLQAAVVMATISLIGLILIRKMMKR